MKTKHLMTAFAAATLLLSACSKEEMSNTGKEWDGRLYLSSRVAELTRAATSQYDLDTKIAEDEKVWLYVDKSGDSQFYKEELKANASNGFTKSPSGDIDDLFFPADEATKITFYAIHGDITHGSSDATMPGNYPAGTTLTHTVAADQTTKANYAKSDLLYAKTELTKTAAKSNSTVALTFKHLLSKIEVVLVKGTGMDTKTISKVEILNTQPKGTFTPAKATEADAVAVAATTDGVEAISIDTDDTEDANKTSNPTLNEAIIIPQTVAAELEFIKVTLSDNGVLVYKIPAGGGGVTFEKGNKYRYTITANMTGLEVTSTVTDWGTTTPAEGDATM